MMTQMTGNVLPTNSTTDASPSQIEYAVYYLEIYKTGRYVYR